MATAPKPPAPKPRITPSPRPASQPIGPWQSVDTFGASPYPQYQGLSAQQLWAQANQLAGIQMQPQYDAIAQGQAYAQAIYQAQLQRSQAIASALQGLVGGIGGQVQGVFNKGAKSQEAFGKGYSDGLRSLLQGSADTANQYLTNVVGAPAGQLIPSSQATDTGDVLNMLGGKLPAEQFKAQGKGYAQAAQRFPMEVTARQNIERVGAEQQYGATSADFANQLAALAKQNPLVVAQYLDELYTQQRQEREDFNQQQRYQQETAYGRQQDARSQAMTLYNAGMLTQRQLALQLGLPTPGKYPNATKDQLTPTAPILKTVGGSLYAINPRTGRVSTLIQGPTAAEKPTVRTVGGYLYQLDTRTGQWVPVAGEGTAPKTVTQGGYIWQQKPNGTWARVGGSGPAAGKPANYQHVSVGGKQYVFDPQSGTFYDPATGQPVIPKNSPAKGITASTLAKGRQLLGQIGKPFYATSADPSTALSTSALNGIISQYNQVAKAKGHTQITLANVEAATPQQLGILGLTKGATTPSQAYLSMVRVGVPARRAWQMVRSKYPQWGKGFFRPKADAAVEPAASRAGMYPTSIRGKIIGVPNQGSHTLYGNWQSDNAVDIAVPTGTPIYAMWSGTIGPRIGPFKSGDPHLQGSRLTLIGQSDQAYYAHLSKVVVRPGQKVRAGQLLGYSGSANGVQHLHWATENRDPRSYLSESPASTVPPPINRRGSSTVPAAQISLAQKYGAQYGVDPRVLLAIAGHETQWGTTGAGRRGYTLGFGVTDSVTLSRYRGVENQYRHAAQLLAKWGVRTIDDIMGGKAASYATDPGWEQGVYSVYSGLV